uniref:Protein kinase domain-containing protein n=1 Tax=Meloidogyne hapla TaxID=6305 RepID=A0A1I8BR69_MELHA
MSIVLELGSENLIAYYAKNKNGENDVKLLTKILISAAEALAQFHTHAIHLDIKPENFVRSREKIQGGSPVFKLIDFGTSELTETFTKKITREVLGTDMYMAPEIDNPISTKADTYSFGVMIYKLLYSISQHIGNKDECELGKLGADFERLDHLIKAKECNSFDHEKEQLIEVENNEKPLKRC